MSWLGATHPNLVRDQGEAYRESLISRVRELGVEDHVVFPRPVRRSGHAASNSSRCATSMSTPYLNEAQMTSEPGLQLRTGEAVVSTPYWHARELLAHGRGVLVPFDRRGGDRQRNRDCSPTTLAGRRLCRPRLCGQPNHDMGTRRRALRIAFENASRVTGSVVARSDTASPEPRSPRRLTCKSAISCDVRRYRCIPARGAFGARSLARLLVDDNARRCCCLRAEQSGRAAPAGSSGQPALQLSCSMHGIRHPAISKLHELQPHLA